MKLQLVCLVCTAMLLLSACSNKPDQQLPVENKPTPEATTPVEPTTPADTQPNANTTDPRLDKISVIVEYDTALSEAIVHIENQSDEIFDGTVHVRFKNEANRMVGNETIFVEQLNPSESTYARIAVSETANITITHEFSKDCKFIKAPTPAESTANADLSQAITEAFNTSFGYPGNETTWFSAVDKIEVFTLTDGSNSATVTVNTDDNEKIDRIGNTIFGNYANKHNLSKVIVVDAAGAELFSRA